MGFRSSRFRSLVLCVFLPVAFFATRLWGDTVDLGPSNRGWFTDNPGANELAGQGQLGNFIVGNDGNPVESGGGVFRNFFVFDIPAINGVVTGVELELQEPPPNGMLPGGYLSLDPTETYEIHGIADSISSINAAAAYNPVIFNDIADGVIYGHAVVKKSDPKVIVPLNAALSALIESSQGQSIAIGGVLTSVTAGSDRTQEIFAASQNVAYSVMHIFVQEAPKVTVVAPLTITSTTARLRATVNPNGLASKVTFAVDGNPVPGNVSLPAGMDDKSVLLNVIGLAPDSDHQVTVTGTSLNGTLTASDGPLTFHTAVQPTPPVSVPVGGSSAISGKTVPGAGTFPGLPAGAMFAQFGLPCLDTSGALAFRAVLAGHPARSVIIGPTAPGVTGPLAVTGGTLPGPGALTYATFSDPVVGGPASGASGAGAFGRTAFTVTVKGAGVKPANNTALLSTATADGSLGLLARTGDPLLAHKLAAILSYAVDGDGNLCALVRFANGGGINSSNNVAFVQWVNGVPAVLVAMGDTIMVNATPKVVASVVALQPADGSAGAARGPVMNGGSVPACRVTFTKDGSQAIVRGTSKVEAYTGAAPPFAGTDEEYLNFGLPAGGPKATFSANLRVTGAVKAGQNALLIVPESNGTLIPIRYNSFAPGLGLVKMTTYTQPMGGEDAGVACLASLQGPGVNAANNRAVLWVDGGGFRRLAAREGDPAPGILSATLASVTSVALPPGEDNGPIFTGKLKPGGGVNAANSTVLWCAYPVNGGQFVVTDKLLRTGDAISIDGNMVMVTSLSALQGAAHSLAQGRCYNALGQVAVLVGYKSGGVAQQAIVTVQIP